MDAKAVVEQLQLADGEGEQDKVLETMLNVLTDPEYAEGTEDISNDLVEAGILDEFYKMASSAKLVARVGQVLAEVAKTENVRLPCVEKGFVPIYLSVLEKNEDMSAMTQACRVLGNMCYDNDVGREMVDEHNGIPILLTLLQSLLKSTEDGSDKLRTIACGFLLNLTNTHEVLQEKALEAGAIELMDKYLQQYKEDEGLCNMVLVSIVSMTDSDLCRDKLLSSSLCETLVNLILSSKSEEHFDTVMDLLVTLTEWDEVKDKLAQTSLCSFLIKLIEENSDDTVVYTEDKQQKVKVASDLLILLLTGEKSMDILFDNGKGPIFQAAMKWISKKEEHLQLSGALAIGNFARSDEHCQFLVEESVIEGLLSLIKPVYGESKCTLEHAALSALRNLAIPAFNKAALFKAGVIDAVLVLVDSELFAVTFKMLGVLRMLVDGQEEAALRLGSDREFITRLVEWCAVDEHPGVKGEATRLLSWLVKNSRSDDVMRSLIRADGIPHLINMTQSEHVVMQNEALIALTLICSTVLADAAVSLKESDLTGTIVTILKNEKTLPEILCNTLTLTKSVCTSASPPAQQSLSCTLLACTGFLSDVKSSLKEELVNSGIADIVRELSNHKEEKVQEAAQSLITKMEELQIER